MCGIFGYIGPRKAMHVVIEGLKRLEYRGYDSAGVAAVQDQKIVFCKEVGKVSVIEQEVKKRTSTFRQPLHKPVGQPMAK